MKRALTFSGAVHPRRQFLRIAAGMPIGVAGWLSHGCAPETSGVVSEGGSGPEPLSPSSEAVLVPKVNGGINVHSLRCWSCSPTDDEIDARLIALQLSAVYELGFKLMRIGAPLGDRNTFLSTIAYVRAARALGIDVLVLLADFSGLTLARALRDESRHEDVLRMYHGIFAPAPVLPRPHGLKAGRIAFQILNEPVGFVGLPPDVYVQEVLTPCYVTLSQMEPRVIVVSAAEVGLKVGVPRMRAMLEAGLEASTDRIAYHIYDPDVIPLLPQHVRNIVWITETGAPGVAAQLPWVRDVIPAFRAHMSDVSEIFYYDLFDLEPGGYRVLDIQPAGDGFQAVVESTALHAYWSDRVTAAAAGNPLLGFQDLVPDIRAYFPTQADVEALDSVLQS
jgi:hypothetical protein